MVYTFFNEKPVCAVKKEIMQNEELAEELY